MLFLRKLCPWVLVLSACATTRPDRGSPAVTGAGVSLEVLSLQEGQATPQPVFPGDMLRSGDRLTALLSASEPVYVYAARLSPAGAVEVFFPAGGPAQARPQVPVHVPGEGQYLRLDGTPGEEDLRVVASRQPLSPEQVQAEAQRTAGDDGVATRDPTTTVKEKQRGTHVLKGRLGPSGVVMLRFSFHHL